MLRKDYNEKCDIWSSGVLLYLLISGIPPFDGSTENAILESVMEGKVKFKHPEWTYQSVESKHIIKCMLAYDPAVRLSAKECLEHPWFTSNEARSEYKAKKSAVLTNLKTFRV